MTCCGCPPPADPPPTPIPPPSHPQQNVARWSAEALSCAVLVPVCLGLFIDGRASAHTIFRGLEVGPSFLLPAAARLEIVGAVVRRELFADKPLLEGNFAMVVIAGFAAVALEYLAYDGVSLAAAARQLLRVALVSLAGSAATKLRPTSKAALDDMAQRLGLAAEQQVLNEMRARLSAAASEQAVIGVAADALRQLFPSACGVALASFAEGSGTDCVAICSVSGADAQAARALADSLPTDVAADRRNREDGRQTSVWFVCNRATRKRVPMADSRDFRRGVSAFPDWAAAVSGGLRSSKAVTVPLSAGPVVVGFLVLHFTLFKSKEARSALACLREFCDSVGGAIFVRRAFAINRDAPADFVASTADPVASVLGFVGTAASDAAAARTGSRESRHSTTVIAETAEDRKLLEALDGECEGARRRLLDWDLDAWGMNDEQVKGLMLQFFHTLGLLRAFGIPPHRLRAFIDAVSSHYRRGGVAPCVCAGRRRLPLGSAVLPLWCGCADCCALRCVSSPAASQGEPVSQLPARLHGGAHGVAVHRALAAAAAEARER